MSIDQKNDVIYDAEPISCILPKGLSDELMNNWKIKEKPRTNGRIDRVCYQFYQWCSYVLCTKGCCILFVSSIIELNPLKYSLIHLNHPSLSM
jgi:hypothetical protein